MLQPPEEIHAEDVAPRELVSREREVTPVDELLGFHAPEAGKDQGDRRRPNERQATHVEREGCGLVELEHGLQLREQAVEPRERIRP